MNRLTKLTVIAFVVALIGILAYFVVTNNQLGKPCPSGGCARVLVIGGASLQGKVQGNPTQVIFTATDGQTYTANVTVSGKYGSVTSYGPLYLPNDEIYSVTVKSGFGGSCSAGSLDLKSTVQGISWNANC